MNREIKFTADGKKVVVIGSLNSQEKIVQEIFIVDGSEIPSGEHFVAKSLHDAPAVSWKESELKKLELRCEKERGEFQAEINRNYKLYKEKTNEFRKKYSYIASALKNADEKSFETLCDFICGDIKYIVTGDYEILSFEKFNQMYEDQLRLFSLFGKDDGTFTYAVGQYYDFSGSHRNFYPFNNYQDAFERLKSMLIESRVNSTIVKKAAEYKIVLDKEKVAEYVKVLSESINRNIDSSTKSIESNRVELQKLSELLK